jgi:2-methylisocitrate lyase-like PEP mutase family enzyme
MIAQPATRLRALLREEPIVLAPGAFGPMPAKLAVNAGFDAVYMPGGGIAMNRLGVADLGLVTMTEMVDAAGAIVRAVDVPVIADADTGFGNLLNVRRAVQEFERAGVAAIHIEDQVFPKKCGHFSRKQLIPLTEAAQKIRAAVDARSDPDFMIIARCDALAVTGFDDVMRRCEAYMRAGADMLFVDSPQSIQDVEDIPRRIHGPHLYNQSAGGKTVLPADTIAEFGYKLMIFPNFTALAAIRAIEEVLAEIKRSKTVAGVLDRCATFEEFTALGGLAEFNEIERRFAAPDDKLKAVE